MSSDGRSDLPSNPHHSARGESVSPPPSPRSGSPSNTDIIEAIQLLQLGTPPINSVEFAKTTSILAHLRPLTPFTGHADHHRMAEGATTSCSAAVGREELCEVCCRDDSHHPDYKPDKRHCA